MNRRQLFGLIGAAGAAPIAAAIPETRKAIALTCGQPQCAECLYHLSLEKPREGPFDVFAIETSCQNRNCKNYGVTVIITPQPMYAK